jgi:hypothetical protein
VALPVGLFLAGWLRPGWAVPLVAILLVGVVTWARRLRAAGATAAPVGRPASAFALAGAALAVAGVAALTGAGGFGVQTWDWAKHNAILRDLVEQPWPVAYATGQDDVALTYYVAYYLPAALGGKVAGWKAANVTLFVWTTAGAVLAMLWLVVLSGAPVWRCVAIFVLFSGLDLVGAATWSSRWRGAAWIRDFNVEWWARHWTYPGNVTLLAFAPHQAIGAWLLTGLALDGLRRHPGRSPHVLGAALGLLWSPFATIGLTGLAALDWVTAWRQRGGLRGLVRDAAEVAGGLTALVLVAYFASRYWPVALPERYYPTRDRLAAAALTFLPGRIPWRRFVADYAVFVGLEFLVLAAVLAAVHRRRAGELRLLGVATATLLALPLLRYGYFNDLVMRVSIPAMFVLQVLAAQATDVAPRRSVLTGALVAILLIGAAYPANMLRMAATAVVRRGELVRIPPWSGGLDLFQQQLAMRGHYFYVWQYIGAVDAPFFRHLARRPLAVPKGSPPNP